MTKLEMVLERIRQLPQERQDAIALEMEFLLEDESEAPVLTPEQEAELDSRLNDSAREYVSHDEVRAYFEKKFGR
ncbi:MAG: hypothetical protein ABUL73_04385 [Alphaproteobacteria bacterium]